MLFSILQRVLKEIAPPENGLSNDLYGLQFGSLIADRNYHKIVICLDPTTDVIKQAQKLKANLIISHHGLIHRPILYFNDTILESIKLLSIYNIELFVMHTGWDAANGGISETLAHASGLNIEDNFYFDDHGREKPIGRIGKPVIENVSLSHIAESLKRNLCLDAVQIGGDPDHVVQKAVVVGGKGLTSDYVLKAILLGCDTFISGEYTYPEYLMARKLGLNLIGTSHYKSEKIGMQNLQKILISNFPRDEFFFVESTDPIKYVK